MGGVFFTHDTLQLTSIPHLLPSASSTQTQVIFRDYTGADSLQTRVPQSGSQQGTVGEEKDKWDHKAELHWAPWRL